MTEKSKVTVSSPKFGFCILAIKGETSLISNRLTEEVVQGIEDKKIGQKIKLKSQPKSPEEQYKNSLHPIPGEDGKYGFPAQAFMKSAISAAKGQNWWEKGMDGKRFKASVKIMEDIVPIKGNLGMRKDIVREPPGPRGAPAWRYRGEFSDWSCELPIKFNPSLLSIDEIVAVFNAAGFGIGVGDWRPEKDGLFGMFKVENIKKATKTG